MQIGQISGIHLPVRYRKNDRLRQLLGDALAVAVLTGALVLHVAGLASLHFGYLNYLFNDAENRLGQGSDFFAVYQAGHDFLHGVSVYMPHTSKAGSDVPYAYPFRYLPSVGFSFGALLNLLPAWPAYWTWAAFNELLLVINVAITWRVAGNRALKVLGVSMWLVYSPFYIELFMGQFNFLMATLIFWLGLTLREDRRLEVFGSWTASLLAKTNSLILLPVAWRTGWLRIAIGGIVVAGLINLPYFLTVHGAWQTWSGNFSFLGSGADVDPHAGNLGLTSIAALLREEGRSGLAGDVARLAGQVPWGSITILVSIVATLRASTRRLLPLLALWLCVYFFVFNDVWEHQYVMLLPALVLLVLFDDGVRPWALVVFVFLALPTPYAALHAGSPRGLNYQYVNPQQYWSSAEVYAYHLTKVLPALILWAVSIWTVVHDPMPPMRIALPWRRRTDMP
ncbi:MAG TPA: glycosyltransferase family 87 protein [Dehalococcoidia bacterium]|nr:glycosyltransferase family 87 protein [Dehalococcoidia bacterium]